MSVMSVTTKATGCEILLYVVLYLRRSWCISQKKKRLYINWYNFLGHEYSVLMVL